MMRLTYPLKNGQKLILIDEVTSRLFFYQQNKKNQNEAGGLLIGHYRVDTEHIVVNKITEPTWADKRLRAFFYRTNGHNRTLRKAWKKSGKTETLVGLWHTHPEPIPNPSLVDWNDWRQSIIHGDFVGENLYFLILGQQAVRVWQGNRSTHFIELTREF